MKKIANFANSATLQAFAAWEFLGAPWTSWIWINTRDVEQARQVVDCAKAVGSPRRKGAGCTRERESKTITKVITCND